MYTAHSIHTIHTYLLPFPTAPGDYTGGEYTAAFTASPDQTGKLYTKQQLVTTEE